jgi:hypothetical protein
MPGIPGKTNNPNGRPAKSRALTDLLVKALGRTVDVDGKKIAGKRVLARLVSEVLVTGRLKFPGDTETSVISVKDWLEFAKWAYTYLEPPVTKLAGEDGEAIRIVIQYENDNPSTPEAT